MVLITRKMLALFLVVSLADLYNYEVYSESVLHPLGVAHLPYSDSSLRTLKALTLNLNPLNQNLFALQKVWLRWHFKLGHIGFAQVAKLARGSFLDRQALGLRRN